jgi:hypothetical protein
MLCTLIRKKNQVSVSFFRQAMRAFKHAFFVKPKQKRRTNKMHKTGDGNCNKD